MIFSKDQETKMSQASDPMNQTPSATRVTQSKAKEDCSKVVIDVVLISFVPNHTSSKKKTKTSARKKTKSKCVSVSETASISPSIPTSNTKEANRINTLHVAKKPRTMTSLYIDPIKIQNASQNVTTSTCDPTATKINVETLEKTNSESRSHANPRSAKNVSQEITAKDPIDDCVYESPSKTSVDDMIPNGSKTVDNTSFETLKETIVQSDVVKDVITYVVQSDTPIVTSCDNIRQEPKSESVPEREKSLREETTDVSKRKGTVSGKNQNSGSKGENDNSTDTREDDKTVSDSVSDKEKGDKNICWGYKYSKIAGKIHS